MQEKNSLKLNAVLNIIKTISSIIFPLITFPYISRVLGPENIGTINFGSAYVSYFALIASLGITTYAIRACSAAREDGKKLGQVASEIFSINVCTTVTAYVLLLLSLMLFRKLDSYRYLIMIQSTAILFTTWGTDWLNSAMEDFKFITLRTVSFQIISLVLMFLFVRSPEDYLKYAAITVISSSGASLTNVIYRKKYCRIRFVRDMNWNTHFKSIVLLFVMILAQNIFNSSDITMLGLMKGDYEVGLYSTAVKTSALISQIVSSMAWVIMPRMALYFIQENYQKINEMLRKALDVLITLGMPCMIGAMCLSDEIILLISGEEYLAASPALCILMVSFGFSLVGGSFLGNMVLLPSGREGLYMKICCISTAVNLVLNYFLIPVWGVNAAAFTTALSSFLILLMLLITKDKRISMDYLPSALLAPCIGCIAIVIICICMKHFAQKLVVRIILSIGLSAVTYACIQIRLKNAIVMQLLTSIMKKVA